MNFINALAELDKLYESIDVENIKEEELVDVEEGCQKKDLKEEVEEDVEEEIEEAEVAEEEAPAEKQVVFECANCGALVIKSEEADPEEECSFCGEAAGYKAIGAFEPYEEAEEEAPEEDAEEEVIEIVDDEEVVEEGLFDKTPKTIRGYKAGDIGFSQRIAKELAAQFGGEVKQVKTKQGKEDVWVDTEKKAKAAEKYVMKKYPDNAFSFNEYEQLI